MPLQVHILGVGLAVHEKLVHPEMRPLHKKLVDQFHMMRTGLHHVSRWLFYLLETFSHNTIGASSVIGWRPERSFHVQMRSA